MNDEASPLTLSEGGGGKRGIKGPAGGKTNGIIGIIINIFESHAKKKKTYSFRDNFLSA